MFTFCVLDSPGNSLRVMSTASVTRLLALFFCFSVALWNATSPFGTEIIELTSFTKSVAGPFHLKLKKLQNFQTPFITIKILNFKGIYSGVF